jgi:zinc transport system substrate-binding protein
MKRKSVHIKRIVALVALLSIVVLGVAFAVTRGATDEWNTGKMQVIASYYPLYDFTKQVGGDKVQVHNITPAGTEPHDFEPSPKALVDAQQTDVFVYNGGSLEPWTDKFIQDYTQTVVKASDGINVRDGEAHAHADEEAEPHGHQEERHEIKDPHFWLDPVLAQQIVNNIRDGLVKADPANQAYYSQNAKNYNAKLMQLDKAFADGLRACQQDTIITSHESFGYVASRYHFAVEAIAGISPDQDPSAARLAALSDHVKEDGIGYIFFESLVSPRLADTIAQETGAKTLVLDPIEGLSNEAQQQGQDYLSVQRQNLANLRIALACQ